VEFVRRLLAKIEQTESTGDQSITRDVEAEFGEEVQVR
jgi:hypothetical protein